MARNKRERKSPPSAPAPAPAAEFAPRVDSPPGDGLWPIPNSVHLMIPWALVVTAAALRFFDLGGKGLWFDEVRTLTDTTFTPTRIDPHWMFFLITRRFLPLAADETIGVRLYPALAGSLTPALIYLFVSRLWSRTAGLFAALIACFQPFAVFYSQEGRYYAPMMLFSALSFLLILAFAQTASRWRFALLPVWVLLAWLSVGNHPTAEPFMAAQGLALAAAPFFTAWGLDAVFQIFPPLRRAAKPRVVMLWTGAALAALAALILRRNVARALKLVFGGPWGETPEVDFTLEFFARHLREFGWDIGGLPVVGAAMTLVNFAAMAGGFVLLVRRRAYFAGMFAWLVAATLLAIFVYQTKTGYLAKYVAFFQPLALGLFAIGTAALLEAALKRVPIFRGAAPAAAAACAALLVLAETPGLARYYRLHKMPVRPQMEWINRNEPEGADLYIYGHGGYCAAFYADRLAPRHRIKYFPWAEDDGALEVEVLKGAGTRGRPAYFAFCWPKDMPAGLTQWLKTKAAVAAQFPSVLGEEYAGVLYRIPSEPDERHRGAVRPAAAIDEVPSIGRPAIVMDPEKGAPALRFLQQATVRYAYPFRAGDTYLFEADMTSGTDRPHFLSIFPGAEEPRIVGGSFAPNKLETLRCQLEPKADATELNLRYVSDYQEFPGLENALLIREIRVRPRDPADPQVEMQGYIPFSPLQPFILGAAGEAEPPWDWQIYPQNSVEIEQDRGRGHAVVRAPMGLNLSSIISPGLRAAPTSLVHARGRVRMNGSYGVVATMTTLFLDDAGTRLGNPTMSSAHLISRLGWENWLERLIPPEWHEFETVRMTPSIPCKVGVTALIWKSTWAKRHPEAPNEVWLEAPEVAVVELVPVEPEAPPGAGAQR